MTDLKVNQYPINPAYAQNLQGQSTPAQAAQGYGDASDYYQPAKEKAKEEAKKSFLYSAFETFIGDPKHIIIGTIPFFGVDWVLKRLSKGNNHNETLMGKAVKTLDNISGIISEKAPKFTWLKDKYNNSALQKFINAPSAKPRFAPAKGQVSTMKNHVYTQFLSEAIDLAKPDIKDANNILKELKENPASAIPKAFAQTEKLVGQETVGEFNSLKSLLAGHPEEKHQEIFTKFMRTQDAHTQKLINLLFQHESAAPEKQAALAKKILKQGIKISQQPSAYSEFLRSNLDNSKEAAERMVKILNNADKAYVKNPELAERYIRRYVPEKLQAELLRDAKLIRKGHSFETIVYKHANVIASGKEKSSLFLNLRNRAQFYAGKNHSAASKLLTSCYNNVCTFLTANFRFKNGIRNIGGNAMKLGGGAFMLFMGANLLGKIIKDTWNAPKGEKTSTFAHGLFTDLGNWIMMIPIGIGMYKGLGSLKSINFVKGQWLKNIAKAPVKLVSKFLNMGLETPEAKGWFNLKKIPHAFSRVGGGVVRFGLFFGLSAVVDKILGGVSHSIFGTPKDLLAKEKAKEEAGNAKSDGNENNEELMKKSLEANRAGMITVNSKTNPIQAGNSNQGNSFIQRTLKNSAPVQPQNTISQEKPQLIQNTALSQENPFQNKPQLAEKKKFVPDDTIVPTKEQEEEKAKFEETLAKTDRIIKDADDVLGGNDNKK